MLDEIKKDLLLELKEKASRLKQEEENLNFELGENEIKEKELLGYQVSPNNDSRYISFVQNYSKLSKVFNKKKFISEKQRLYGDIKEEYHKKRQEMAAKINEIKTRIGNIKKEVEEISKHIQVIDKIKNLGELPISFEKVQELLAKNNVDIYKYSAQDILSLGQSNQTSSNVMFMRKAIKENPLK